MFTLCSRAMVMHAEKPRQFHLNCFQTLAGANPSPIWAVKGENPLSNIMIINLATRTLNVALKEKDYGKSHWY